MMAKNNDDFKTQIEKEIKNMFRKQMVFSAWLSAVRALPFLGVSGSFKFWEDTEKRKHLYSVLYALDCSVTASDVTRATDVSDATATATATAADTATAAATAYDDSAYSAVYSAAFAVLTGAAAVNAATNAATNAVINAHVAAKRCEIDLSGILFADIKKIRANNYSNFHHDTNLYGPIWERFQEALRGIGCAYWGELYTEIFKSGFNLNKEALKRRLSVPPEIRGQGAEAVARHLENIEKYGAERLNETRILILGEKGSGKTSIALRLKDPAHEMPKEGDSTEGVDIIDWNIPKDSENPDSAVNVHIWDFAGHVITHAAHRCFMSERCLYILLINGRTEGDNRTEYWLEQIRNYGRNSPVLVLVNIRDKHCIEILEKTLKNTFPSIRGFYQVDIDKGGTDLEDFRSAVIEFLRNNPLWKNQKISAPVYKVKETLRKRFTQGNEFITRDEFDRIAKENGVAPEECKQLLEDLNALGICLWYDSDVMREFNTMVLNPSWISHGIYRLINWGMNNRKNI